MGFKELGDELRGLLPIGEKGKRGNLKDGLGENNWARKELYVRRLKTTSSQLAGIPLSLEENLKIERK